MGAIFTWLASFISGPFLASALKAYQAKLQSDTDQNQMAANLAAKAVELDVRERQVNAQIIAADNGSWFMRTPRALVQWSLALYICKCVIWDTVLGLGSTPTIGGQIGQWFGVIVAFWFGGRTAEKVATIMSNRFRK